MKCSARGPGSLGDTRAYFPSREEAERFARQFAGDRCQVAIHPEHRQGRDVFQVHVRIEDPAAGAAPADMLRLVGAVGVRAKGAGLDGEALSRRMGRALGEAIALKGAPAPVERREALPRLAGLLTQCGLGGLSVVSVTPLVLRVRGGALPNDHGRACAHVAGFVEGALGAMLGREAPPVREIDCVGLGSPDCTFSVDF